jgi:hypothetical protein
MDDKAVFAPSRIWDGYIPSLPRAFFLIARIPL